MEARRLSLEFPADTSVLSRIGKLVANAGREAGFGNGEIGDIQLAVDEACTNTISHGLRDDPTRTFQLAINWKIGEVEILIHELGTPFDPEKIRLPDLYAGLEERPIGGLGVFLIKKLMDVVEFYVGDGGKKTFRMVKRK